MLMEFAAILDLTAENVGRIPTYQGPQYGSVIDFTLTRMTGSWSVKNWKIHIDTYSKSDHNYISYNMINGLPLQTGLRNNNEGWAIKKSNRKKLEEYIEQCKVERTGGWPGEDTDTVVERIHLYMRSARDAFMPNRATHSGHRPIYWRNDKMHISGEDAYGLKGCII